MKVQEIRGGANQAKTAAIKDGYVELELTPGRAGLGFSLAFTPDGGRERSTRGTLGGVDAGAFDTMRYTTRGSTGNVGYHDQGAGAGVLVAAGDAKRGLLLVDLAAEPLVSGADPQVRALLTPKQILSSAAVKRFAQASGVNPAKAELTFEDVRLSAAFESKAQHTLMIRIAIDDGRVSQTGEFTAVLSGDLAKGPSALRLGKLEAGAVMHQGWTLPPSASPELDRFEGARRKNKFAA